jgi:hypothetical protein
MPSTTFKGAKNGYAFKTGNRGTGYYRNTGGLVVQGPQPAPIPAEVGPPNIDVNEAVNKIKKLQLKRENHF